jgi:hypothetical protein
VVNHLFLNHGEITGTGTLEIANSLDWVRGKMSGTGTTTIKAGAVAKLGGQDYLYGDLLVLDRRTFDNRGTVIMIGHQEPGDNYNMSLHADNGAVIENRHFWYIDDDSDIFNIFGVPGTFNNRTNGLLQKRTLCECHEDYWQAFRKAMRSANSGTVNC